MADERLFKRIYSRGHLEVGLIGGCKPVGLATKNFDYIVSKLRDIGYYALNEVEPVIKNQGEIVQLYLISGGVVKLRNSTCPPRIDMIEILTESSQGLVTLTEHLHLPFNEDGIGKRIPSRK
ncbi:MAG: hypothetical protein AABX17_03000 [Nanoarchaeota archaeon]